jgi:predicted HicB family RNase H-like nuclease
MTSTEAPRPKQKKTLIEVAPQLHSILKVRAAQENKSLKEVTETLIKSALGLNGTATLRAVETHAS